MVEVKIFDKHYHIECPVGEQEDLFAAADCLEKRMRLMQSRNPSNTTSERLVMITALNLANDLLMYQHISSEKEKKMSQYVQETGTKLIEKIARNSTRPATKSFARNSIR